MHVASIAGASEAAGRARNGDAADLHAALCASRTDTLATFARYEQALPGLAVPQRGDLNPPLWELGHIGWFQDWWIARNPQRALGLAANPDATRKMGVRAGEDALYNSSLVPHATRWQLPLPDAEATRRDLHVQLERTLAALHGLPAQDMALYFHRLALFHEDMHHEAALYMAQALGVPIDDARWQAPALPAPAAAIAVAAHTHTLGSGPEGFAFDNEWGVHPVAVTDHTIDAQVLRWAEYLPFIESGAYYDDHWWPEAIARGWARPPAPRYLQREGGLWLQWRHGEWRPLNLDEPACHLSWFEAQAWCRWSGRRLPTEAEWESAALRHPDRFAWGAVWEWTASPFEPYPGFAAHPYRDYSAPWFGGSRFVLRGASFMTQPRMAHVRYRNYFMPDRADVAVGLRTCAV